MAKVIKMIVGLLLLPLCVGAAMAVWRVLLGINAADRAWVILAAGAGLWVLIYFLLPRPMWLYVLGHELTHAMWTWCFGGRISRIKVSSEGGHVMASKTNFLVALAPYFFPFYVVVVVVMFLVARLFIRWDLLEVWFLGLLGIAYAFHVTLTAHTLRTRQSDITQHGYLFSAVVIFIGNAFVLLVGIPLLTSKPTVSTALLWCWESSLQVVQSIRGVVG